MLAERHEEADNLLANLRDRNSETEEHSPVTDQIEVYVNKKIKCSYS